MHNFSVNQMFGEKKMNNAPSVFYFVSCIYIQLWTWSRFSDWWLEIWPALEVMILRLWPGCCYNLKNLISGVWFRLDLGRWIGLCMGFGCEHAWAYSWLGSCGCKLRVSRLIITLAITVTYIKDISSVIVSFDIVPLGYQPIYYKIGGAFSIYWWPEGRPLLCCKFKEPRMMKHLLL